MKAEPEARPKPRPGRMNRKMAEVVLQEYAASGMNATEAAKRAGYKESTANSRGYDIVAIATERILEAAAQEKRKPSISETRTVLDVLGLTPIDAIREYLKILGQDRDMATKHRALLPVMKHLHSSFSEDEVKQTSPVTITVERLNVDNKGDSERVAQSTLSDTIRDIAVDDSPADVAPEAPTSPAVE
jgi:hypothetical protein